MAATTITRSTWTNDTGTAANPNLDGTILNNAQLQLIYDNIDNLIGAAITFGGLVHADGFGAHTWSAAGTGGHSLTIRNTSAGTTNHAQLRMGTDVSASQGAVTALSSTYTSAGIYTASGVTFEGNQSGGVSLAASHASGVIRFFSGGGVEQARMSTTGGVSIGATTDPGSGGLLLNKLARFVETTAPSAVANASVLYADSTSSTLKLSNDNGAFADVLTGPYDKCGLFHSAAQSITGDGTYRALTFDSEDFDTNTLHSTVTNPTRVTIAVTGVYLLIGQSGDLPTNTDCRMGFRVDGTTTYADVDQGDNQTRMEAQMVLSLTAAQYVELVARHATVTGNWGSATRALATQFVVVRLA